MKGNALVDKLFTKDRWSIYRWKTDTSEAYARHDCVSQEAQITADSKHCWRCGIQTPNDINALVELFNYGLSTQRPR